MQLSTKRGRFEVVMTGSDSAPTTVVLVHGFPFAAASWEPDAEALSPAMRVIAPSMRGFGESDAPDGTFTIDTMAEDVAAILDELGVAEPVVMGGLSMGGYVALSFVRQYPARVRALVLADTRAEPDGDAARANRDKAIAQVEGGDGAAFLEGLLPMILAPSTRAERPEVVERVRTMGHAAKPESLVAALRALRDRPDARPGLAAIDVPVLIVVGEDDGLTPPSASAAMAGALPAGRALVHVVPKAGHLSNFEQPEIVRSAIAAFVSGLAPPPT
jgi:3-oxoadipate enol-lactonase